MKLLVDAEKVWWEIPYPSDEDSKVKKYFDKMTEVQKASVRTRAATLYTEQAQKYQEGKDMTSADRQWLQTVLSEGTQSDKISAMLVQAKESPFYGMQWVAKLLGMASGTGRSESYAAMEALKEVFLLVLPSKASGRKVVPWKGRPLTDNKDMTPSSLLVIAYFEDILRQSYTEYLKLLEIVLHDQVQNGRERALRVVHEMALAYKSDYTEALLTLLTNKLGDPQRIVASRVLYYLQCIIERHEELTLPTIKLVQSEITKPNPGNDKAAFYGLTFYSQVKLDEGSPEVTDVLLQTYQHYLQSFIQQMERSMVDKRRKNKMSRKRRAPEASATEEGDSEGDIPRTTKVALLGLTRAIPFAKKDGGALAEYARKLLTIAGKIKSYPTLLQASSLIYKIFTQDDGGVVDVSLLGDLVSKHLLDYSRMAATTSSHPPLLKLLYKIVVTLTNNTASASTLQCLRNICKSLLSVACMVSTPAFAAASLLLVSEAISIRPGLRLAITFPDDSDSTDLSSCGLFWELNVLSRHYHPSVARYAKTLLKADGEIDVSQEPDDPFTAMNTSTFLDSFIHGTIKA